MYITNVLDLIGNTPLISLEATTGLQIYAKAEFFNPGGSIKDRAAKAVIEYAEKYGQLENGHIVEATSGNMGISLAMIGAKLGYSVTIVMPNNASSEREGLIRAYGGAVIRCGGGMSKSISTAEDLAREEGWFLTKQFENRACIECHYRETGAEIWRDLGGNVDVFIAGVGTGATLTGVGRFLKERGRVRVVAVEPAESAVISGRKASSHRIDGIGAGFIPKLYDPEIVDEVIAVSSDMGIVTPVA